jgi:prevent-host-death family protein
MIKVSVTKLRNNLSEYLGKVAEGETIVIQRYKQEVARLVSAPKADWRENMKVQPKILVSQEDLIKPLKDISKA